MKGTYTMKIIMRYGILVLMLLTLTAVPLHAAIITVDAADGKVVSNQECSINEAIEIANTDQANVECNITGTLGSDDTIILTKNVTVSGTDDLVPFAANGKNATKSITSQITIDGKGYKLSRNSEAACTLDGENTSDDEFRLMHVAGNGFLTLKNITLENGCADGNDSNSPTTDDGGAIYNLGFLTILNSTITQNKCFSEGGGIFNTSEALLTITRGVLSSNTALKNGGGLANEGLVQISCTTFSGNSAPATVALVGKGGGIYHSGGSTSILGSTFSENSSSNSQGATAEGGALYAGATISEISNSTFSGNTSDFGAAIFFPDGQFAVTTIKNNTFSNNIATNDSGIAHFGATVTNIINNLFAEKGSQRYCQSTGWGSPNASNNLSAGDCPGDAGTTDSNFDTNLDDNGGPTMTHALLAGSNAINAGNDGVCPEIDQRGWFRIDDDCDIGAFEFGARPPVNPITGPNSLLLLQDAGTPPVYENCCIAGVCSPLSVANCQQAGGTPINAPCEPNPCN